MYEIHLFSVGRHFRTIVVMAASQAGFKQLFQLILKNDQFGFFLPKFKDKIEKWS